MPSGHPQPVWERVMLYLTFADLDECWEWTGCRNDAGYGLLNVGGRNVRAHRLVWEHFNGPIPSGKIVKHSCDNPPCCNYLTHLSVGTVRENSQEMIARGRQWFQKEPERRPVHEMAGRAKLTAASVAEIRRRGDAGERPSLLATDFNIGRSQIGRIIRREQWI